MSPPIERYIRCSVTVGNWTVEPGIECREGDDFNAVTEQLGQIAGTIAARTQRTGDPIGSARAHETYFADSWFGRAFFIEVHDAKCERWTQTYQPYGVPLTNR